LYVFQYLAQFGVTPEQVGISQIKLLTRAAVFTLFLLSILGTLPVVVGMVVAGSRVVAAGLRSISEWRHIRPILRRFNLIEQPKITSSSDHAEGASLAVQRARNVRIGIAVTFGVAISLTALLMKPLGYPITGSGIIVCVVLAVVLSIILFLEWRK